MEKRFLKYITIAAFILVIGGFAVMNLVITPPQALASERRAPAAFPKLTTESFGDASFMNGFENWAQDRFPLRETLRTIRAGTIYGAFQQTDKDGLYLGASGAGKFQKIDETAWTQTITKINLLAKGLEDGTYADGGLKLYAAVIPDKSVYAGRYLPGYDPDTAKRLISENLDQRIQAIDIGEALAGKDFYRTDLHWSQPETLGVMDALNTAMTGNGADSGADSGAAADRADRADNGDGSLCLVPARQREPSPLSALSAAAPLSAPLSVDIAGTFKGVYAGQVALPMAPDSLVYVSTSNIDSASASYLDPKTATMQPGKVYYPEALTDGGDPYDFFLNGPQAVIVLETRTTSASEPTAGEPAAGDSSASGSTSGAPSTSAPSSSEPTTDTSSTDEPTTGTSSSTNAPSGKTLYLFRDSFGSSLAPLFLGAYDRVVLIDMRYIDSRILSNYVTFEPGSDVLFLYSSQIMNNPTSLLIR